MCNLSKCYYSPTCVCHSVLCVAQTFQCYLEFYQQMNMHNLLLHSPIGGHFVVFWLCISANKIVLSLSKNLQACKFSEWHTFKWNCWVILIWHCHLYFGVSKLFYVFVIFAVRTWGLFQSVRFMKCNRLIHHPPQHWTWRLVQNGCSADIWWVSNTIGLDCRLFKGKVWILHFFFWYF